MVIHRIDIRKTYNAIDKIDPKAMIVEYDINNIKGGVLRRTLIGDKSPKLHPKLQKVAIQNS